MRKWIIALVVIVVVAGAGWYFGSPWLTLYQVKSAAERKDIDALIGYIDFDAVRSDLKSQMHAQARREAATDHSPIDPEAEAIADQSVNEQVNPTNVRNLLKEAFAAKKPDDAGPATGNTAAPAGGDSDSSPLDQIGKHIAVDRTGFDSFVVRGEDKPDGVRLTFTRHGLGWKLSGVRLPPSAL